MRGCSKHYDDLRAFCEQTPIVDCHDHTGECGPMYADPIAVIRGGYFHSDWNGAVTPCVFVPYSPRNINETFAQGQTLNDVWDDPFFGGIRDWQAAYRAGDSGGDGYTGNWLAPCIIRDHHDDFRRLLAEHEPDPTDENARDALLDPGYAQGMIDYGANYQAVSGNVWQKEYLEAPTSDK